jgi:murein L,D-transpeptidase YcbB/YkuD
MRVRFLGHIAAAAMTAAAIGGALAQSSDHAPQQQDAPPAADAATAPAETAAPAVVAPSQDTKPATGLGLFQVPISEELPAADIAVAEKLREMLATRLSRAVERRQDRAGVEAFYRDRAFAPLWVADGAASPRAKAAIAYLRGVAADGLDPADYPAPAFADPVRLAQDELALTNVVLAFARHARTGRVNFSRVSSAIFYELDTPEAADVLANMANAADLAEALEAYHPQHKAYKALKSKLAEARAQKKAALADTLIANMERWRWMPRELGRSYVTVNIPDFTLKVTDQGRTVWSTRIVVGKVGEQATPLFSETMKFITVNPTWNVPPSIIRNEYMPALARDPNALARIGLKVTHRKDGSIHVYQPPGDQNALGRIRFNFPNRFLVYQHDTPQKHLFAKQQRAYSHGCMRVEHPEQYAEVLLSITQPDERYTAERLRKLYGNRERTIHLQVPIPVHVTYQTAFVDDAGQLQTRPDLYGHDRAILGLMRRGGDAPIAHNNGNPGKPATARAQGRPETPAQASRTDTGPRDQRLARRSEHPFFAAPGYVPPPFWARRGYGAPY